MEVTAFCLFKLYLNHLVRLGLTQTDVLFCG